MVEQPIEKKARKTRGKPNNIDIHVGNQVRQRRTLLRLSQENLAGSLDITHQQVQKYEKGANRIGAGRLFQLARALEVPVGYFFEGLGDESSMLEGDLAREDETRLVVRSFYGIPDSGVRKQFLSLMISVGKEEG